MLLKVENVFPQDTNICLGKRKTRKKKKKYHKLVIAHNFIYSVF